LKRLCLTPSISLVGNTLLPKLLAFFLDRDKLGEIRYILGVCVPVLLALGTVAFVCKNEWEFLARIYSPLWLLACLLLIFWIMFTSARSEVARRLSRRKAYQAIKTRATRGDLREAFVKELAWGTTPRDWIKG